MKRLAIIGGGPAGLMAADVACQTGVAVDLFDAMGSVGRKFLLAGKGGLNLTHSEPKPAFVARYGAQSATVAHWLDRFDADAMRAWARSYGVETFVGSSGRVFPLDLKAAPLLRGWVRHLRERGVRMHMQHRWYGWDDAQRLLFTTPSGPLAYAADACIFALGGGSWAKLGSTGEWVTPFAGHGIPVAPLQPANCGFDVAWSPYFANRFAGEPVKPVVLHYRDRHHRPQSLQGEFVITGTGVEGSAIYAISAVLRDQLAAGDPVVLTLDLVPGRPAERLQRELSKPRGKRSLSEHLRRSAGIDGVQAGLLHEQIDRSRGGDVDYLVARLKRYPLLLQCPRPIDEAISTAGGVRLDALTPGLMLKDRPGLFCAGEMLDWEAPTGGYLLTASMASGGVAGQAALDYLGLPVGTLG